MGLLACVCYCILRTLLLSFSVFHLLTCCLQYAGLRMRQGREKYFLVKYFAIRFNCVALAMSSC